MLKTVLLDFDNTIYDDVGAIRRVFMQLKTEYRFFKSVPLDELISRFYYTDYKMQDMLRQDNAKPSDINLKRTDLFLQNIGLPLKIEMVNEIHERIRELHIKYGKPVPGAAKLLKKLKEKYIVGIVTNHMGDYQREKIARSNFGGNIDFLVPAYDYGVFKPEPEIFSIALKEAGVTPDEAIMIGDNWKADVKGATQSGIVPVWVNFKNQPVPEEDFANVLRFLSPADEVVGMIEYYYSLGLPLISVE